MIQSKHTPGPWIILDEENLETQTDGKSETIVGQDAEGMFTEYSICEVPREAPRDEAIANTRLIAAAPEMLGALENIASITMDCDGTPIGAVEAARLFIDRTRQIAADAIRKVKGDEHE